MKAILAILFFVTASIAFGQTQTSSASSTAATATAGPVTNPVATSLRTILPGRQKNILAAIDAMPADKFSFKPTPDQMTFAHLVMHITESNNGLCSKIAAIPAPKAEEPKETDSKDSLLTAARASFDFCSSALANLDDSKMADTVELYGGRTGPRALAAFSLTGGWADHYAAAAMYLRLNGILPPSAQPKK